MNNFKQSLKYVLVDEGGNDDDKRDHGGRTSRGITQREYDAWCKLNNKPEGDVWDASDEDIKAIYHDQYWNPYCNDLPSGLDYLYFDISVNAGRTQATRTFQKALGVKVDGMFGQVTLNAIKGIQDTPDLIKRISDVRRAFYRALKQYPVYGKGWLNRVEHSETNALFLADTPVQITPAPAQSTKDAEPDTPTVSPQTSGTVATGSGGLIAILQSFSDALSPYKDTIQTITYVLLGLAVVSFGYTMYGFWKNNKTQQAM